MHSVYCIENPLLDHVMSQDYSWLEGFGAKPGTMQLVPYETFRSLVTAAGKRQIMLGGSGANTVRALAFLLGDEALTLGRPAYSGAVGRDEDGDSFASILSGLGVDIALARKDGPTGVSGIVITPDHERTMFTHLGACRDFGPGDISWELLDDSRAFYSTGYMWDTEPQLAALNAAVDRARSRDIPVCFDLADPFVVDRYHAELREWVKGRVSVLFANRDELARMVELTGAEDEEILLAAADLAPLVALKVGKRGCLVMKDGKLEARVPGEAVQAVDTTGAGDSFAAGFLYGLLKGLSLQSCGRIANRIAARIVTIEGCRIDLLDRADVLSAV